MNPVGKIDIGYDENIQSSCFSSDGSTLATVNDCQIVKVWDVKTGKEIMKFEGNTGRIYSVCFSSDGSKLLTFSMDKTVRTWDLK